MKLIDLTGQRFGSITVLYRTENRSGKVCWHCKCDCGKYIDIKSYRLTSGEINKCNYCAQADNQKRKFCKDKVGQRFGKLVVNERLPNYKNGRTYYKCKCDCGNEVFVLGGNLRNGNNHTSSCGCQSSRNGTKQYDFLHQFRYDDNKEIYLIYKHTAPNGKVYIGMTKQSIDRRSQNGNGYKTQRKFYRAIQKYGWNNFKHKILEDNLTHDEACELEQYYIKKYDSNNPQYGYNTTSGGDGCHGRGIHLVQEFNGEVVNSFSSYAEAGHLIGISPTSISKYVRYEILINGYLFKNIPINEFEKVKNIKNLEHLKLFKKALSERKTNRVKKINNERKININQYNLNGEYLYTYCGINETSEKLGIEISNALKTNGYAGGFLWKYDDGNHDNIEPYQGNNHNSKAVQQIDPKSKEIINIFKSGAEAEIKTGIPSKCINAVCNKKRRTTHGFMWSFV